MTASCFKLAGDWDFTRRDELQAVLRPAESLDEVLLDLSEVTFIDASVIGCLVKLRKRMIEHSRLSSIRIVEASRHIVHLLRICELDELFGLGAQTIHEDDANGLIAPSAICGSIFTKG